ncbi:hypothetical protein KAM345_027970 [Aeromonas caviae]|nr:hypothetical protein KAM345_027970 [Aeromonas caviae]
MHSAGMPTTLEQANELIYKLLDRIAELEDRLNQHSGNSSKPPSSDGPGAPPPARKRPASGKQRGAQPGHKGHRRERHPLDARLTLVPHVSIHRNSIDTGKMRRSSLDPTFLLA